MSGFLLMTVGVALFVPLVSHGSYRTLVRQRWHWQFLFAAGFALQAFSGHLPHPGGHDLGFGAIVASYVFLLGFCARNLIRTGMIVVLIGIALNATAITTNHGMPVAVPPVWAHAGGMSPTLKHHALTSADHLYWLSDVIYLPTTDEMISFGDLVLAIGLLDVAFHVSRRRRRTATIVRTGNVASLDLRSLTAPDPTPAIKARGRRTLVAELEATESQLVSTRQTRAGKPPSGNSQSGNSQSGNSQSGDADSRQIDSASADHYEFESVDY